MNKETRRIEERETVLVFLFPFCSFVLCHPLLSAQCVLYRTDWDRSRHYVTVELGHQKKEGKETKEEGRIKKE